MAFHKPPKPGDLPRDFKKKAVEGTLTAEELAEAGDPSRLIEQQKRERELAVRTAGAKARRAALLRRGRSSTILTSGRGVQDKLGSVGRPQARAATLLG